MILSIIHEPTPSLGYWSSCIDLIFIFQDNLETNSIAHSSLHSVYLITKAKNFFIFQETETLKKLFM